MLHLLLPCPPLPHPTLPRPPARQVEALDLAVREHHSNDNANTQLQHEVARALQAKDDRVVELLGFVSEHMDRKIFHDPRPGRGHGVFSSDGTDVIVPLPRVTLEAYIRLASRLEGSHALFFLTMLTYMDEFVDKDGLLGDANTHSPGPCKTFWVKFKAGGFRMREIFHDLQCDLGDRDSDTSSSD